MIATEVQDEDALAEAHEDYKKTRDVRMDHGTCSGLQNTADVEHTLNSTCVRAITQQQSVDRPSFPAHLVDW